MALNSKYITVSGVPTFEEQKLTFPSGVFGQPVNALLSSVNATFGFNNSPHRFDLEYIPELFSYTQLPAIGTAVDFTIGDAFLIKGKVVHSDYTKSDKGKIMSIVVEDIRTELNNVMLDTYGIFGENDSAGVNIIDVRYWYYKTKVQTRLYGRSRLLKDLERLDQHGASYRQIYESLEYCEDVLGTITGIKRQIPTPEIVEAQLPGDPESYKWKFRSTPLLSALEKILTDVAYDYYWDMNEEKIDVINKKYTISINENNIPVAGDTAATINARYGYDKGENPTVIKLYGAKMEGFIGGGVYAPTNGKYGTIVDANAYDLGVGNIAGNITLTPGWRHAIIRYFGPDGNLRNYTPSDRALSLALKGIEYWAAETPGLQSRISPSTTMQDGTTARPFNPGVGMDQNTAGDTRDRLGTIQNRAFPENSWQLEFYNRVRTFAQNYYGRLYTVDQTNDFMNYFDQIEVMGEAWCNLENMTDENSFIDGYKIASRFNALAPFWNPETNKLKAFAVVPSRTKWGEDGKSFPAQFENWNEIGSYQIVPIEVRQWNSTHRKFDEDYVMQWQRWDRGIWIKLPNICWHTFNDDDEQLSDNEYLGVVHDKFALNTRYDFNNPISVPKAFGGVYGNTLTPVADLCVALPVKVNRRYGYNFPSVWSSGTGSELALDIRDDLGPWYYEPRGFKTSYHLMNDEVQAIINSQIVARNTVTFAEAQKVGLPIISFDGFADQNEHQEGFGIVQHGVTSLSLSKSVDGWWQTRYNVKSHFPQFLKIKPVQDSIEEQFKFALHRIKEELRREPPYDAGIKMPGILDDKTEPVGEQFFPTEILDKFDIEVMIDQVYDRGVNEYYSGKDSKGIVWPRALSTAFSSSSFSDNNYKIARCTDGYLQVGMKAIYHFEELPKGGFVHFFTGGVTLSAGRIVEVTSVPELISGIWCSNVRTLPSTVADWSGNPQTVTPFNFFRVPYVTQSNVDTAISVGDKLMLGSNLNKNNLAPDSAYGPNDTNVDTCYLVNASSPSNAMIGYVTTKPNTTTGRLGRIQTITSTGGTSYLDGASVGGDVYNVYFVGCNYDQIETGDFCTITKERETGGAFRLYCLITKPLFMGVDAFGG